MKRLTGLGEQVLRKIVTVHESRKAKAKSEGCANDRSNTADEGSL